MNHERKHISPLKAMPTLIIECFSRTYWLITALSLGNSFLFVAMESDLIYNSKLENIHE